MPPKPSTELFTTLWSRYTSLVAGLQQNHYLPRKISASLLAGIIGAVVLAGGSLAAYTLSQSSSDLRQQAYVAGPDGSGGGVIMGDTGGDNTCGGVYKAKVFQSIQTTTCKTWERATNNGCQSDESCKMGVNQPCSDSVLCKSGLTCTPTSGGGKVCLVEVTNPAGGAQGGDPCQQLGTGWQQADLTCAAGQKKEDSRVGNGAYCHRCVDKSSLKSTIKPGDRCDNPQGCTCSTSQNVTFGSKCPTSQAPATTGAELVDCCVNPGPTQTQERLTTKQCSLVGESRKCFRTNCYDFNNLCGLTTVYDSGSCSGNLYPATSAGRQNCLALRENPNDKKCFTISVQADGTYDCIYAENKSRSVCEIASQQFDTLDECKRHLVSKTSIPILKAGEQCLPNSDGSVKTCMCDSEAFNQSSIQSPEYCKFSKCAEIASSGLPEAKLSETSCNSLPSSSTVYACVQNTAPSFDYAGIWQVKTTCQDDELCLDSQCYPKEYVSCVSKLGGVSKYQSEALLCQTKSQMSQQQSGVNTTFKWDDEQCKCVEIQPVRRQPVNYEQVVLEETEGVSIPIPSSPSPTPTPAVVSNQSPVSLVADPEVPYSITLDPDDQAESTGCRSYMGSRNAFDTNKDGYVAEGVCEYRPTVNGVLHLCQNQIWVPVTSPGQCQQTDSTTTDPSGTQESNSVEIECPQFSTAECPTNYCRVSGNSCMNIVSYQAPVQTQEIVDEGEIPVQTGNQSMTYMQTLTQQVSQTINTVFGLPSRTVLPPSGSSVLRCSGESSRFVDINRVIDNSAICLGEGEYIVECNDGFSYQKNMFLGIFTTSARCVETLETMDQAKNKPIAPDQPEPASTYVRCADYSAADCPSESCVLANNQCQEIPGCNSFESEHSVDPHFLMVELDTSVLARVQRCKGDSSVEYACRLGWQSKVVGTALLCYQPSEIDSLCRAQTDADTCESYTGICSYNSINNTCRSAL